MNNAAIQQKVELSSFFVKVYSFMALAILLTGVTSFVSAYIFTSLIVQILSTGYVFIGMILAQFGILFIINRTLGKSFGQSVFWLFAFSIFEGLLLSPVVLLTPVTTLAIAFISTIGFFGTMAVVGLTTKVDTSRWRGVLLSVTIALVITSLLNIFLFQATLLQMIISWISLIVFSLWTLYDNQQLKVLYFESSDSESISRLAIRGALNLYLDFLNIFMSLVQIFSNRN